MGRKGDAGCTGKIFWRGMGNLRPLIVRGGSVESCESGVRREREQDGKKEGRSGVRNEEKTYDYKGLLITAMAWSGMGLRSRDRGDSGCSTRRIPALAMWERPEGSHAA